MENQGIVQGRLNQALEKPKNEKDLLRKFSGLEDTAAATSMNACFDCNICLDFAVDPVVTLCGHLYCWPCIYKWLQVDSTSSRRCPVCKAPLSEEILVPLYGRGNLNRKGQSEIPHRPALQRDHAFITSVLEHRSPRTNEEIYENLHQPIQHPELQGHYHHHHQYYTSYGSPGDNSYMPSSSSPFPPVDFHSTTAGSLVVSLLPWVFRNPGVSSFYASPHYITMSGNSPRLRRQQMQVVNSLHQISLFLFCCAVLCLLMF